MSVAVTFVIVSHRITPAVALGEHFTRRTDIGSVEEDDCVEAGDGGVHGCYAGVGD